MRFDVVFDIRQSSASSIRNAIQLVNFHQTEFFLKELNHNLDFLEKNQDGSVVYDTSVPNARIALTDINCIVVTDAPFDNNFFSYIGSGASVVTTDSWSEHFAPPSLKVFLAREFVLSFICSCGDITDIDIDQLSLQNSRGCLFDFCEHKADVKFGLTSGYISGETAAKLREFNVNNRSIDAAQRVLTAIRKEAIGNSIVIRPDRAFIVMKYSQNDENANAFRHGILPALREYNFEGFLASDDPSMGILSDRVMSAIEESRLVVIKIDEINPNVYFELGYALGKMKHIYVICKNSMISQIPTDLKGWELVSYPDGGYSELEVNFKRYLNRDFDLRKL